MHARTRTHVHARTYQIPDISRVVLHEPSRSFHVFEVISTPPSRVVGNDICSSQEFQTGLSSSFFADRSARRRDEEREEERNRDRKLNLALSRTAILKRKKEKKDDETPRLQQSHSLVFPIDRINCYDRYQHIRNTKNSLRLVATSCHSRIDTLGYVSFPLEEKALLFFSNLRIDTGVHLLYRKQIFVMFLYYYT